MGNYEQLKESISQVITENGNNEITGTVLQNVLNTIVSIIGDNATFAGVANIDTVPGTPDQNVFYIATIKGTYPNFGITVDEKCMILHNSTGAWQAIEVDIPTFEAFSEVKYKNIFVSKNSASAPENLFIREMYMVDTTLDQTHEYAITRITRYVNGLWYIKLMDNTTGTEVGYYNPSIENNGIIQLKNLSNELKALMIVDWDCVEVGSANVTNVILSAKIFNKDYSPSIKEYLLNNQVSEAKLIAKWSEDSNNGYVDTNSISGGIPSTLVIGKCVKLNDSASFKHIKVMVTKGDVVYIPKVLYTSYTTANPIIVDEGNVLLAIGDSTNVPTFTYKDGTYWKWAIPKSGYLLFAKNTDFEIYSETPLKRGTIPFELTAAEKEARRVYIGAGVQVVPYGNYAPFDYEVAIKTDRTLLKSMIESASNGSCTVIYDDNGLPSLMRRLPIMSIGMLAPTLGDYNTPHPAFVVGGVQKKYIYAGVFMNSLYDGIPVSWFGLTNDMRSLSYKQAKQKCADKGDGWHMETIWERSLISLLSMKYHGTKPRGNTNKGRSNADGYEYECIEGVTNDLPGNFANGALWINGSQPLSWSHDNSRWGIFDIVGGFHEWCDLAKHDNGRIYLCADNNFSAAESSWENTGANITYENGAIVYDTQNREILSELKMSKWIVASCNAGYDSLSLNIRKRLALSLMCPRLSSADETPIFDFDGYIWLQNNMICYPFMGGALEYPTSGLGFNIMSYDGDEAHNNMGSRLFYIE